MNFLRGRPLDPQRLCDTVSYELTQGKISEQALYEQTTAYIRYYYNQARLLNRQLEGMGYAGQVAFIHGGLSFEQLDAQVEHFRRPQHGEHGGARFFAVAWWRA